MEIFNTRKVLVWGIGLEYEFLLNQLLYEKSKGNISVEALVCRNQDKYCSYKDTFPVITKEEIKIDAFDYLIIASANSFSEIKAEAMGLGILEYRIINGQIFNQPLFDFSRYVSLIENPVTILSDDCWGGYVYNRLGLRFTSPLINILWDRDQFSQFIQDPLYYLNMELTMVSDGDLKKGIYPIGKLGTHSGGVTLKFIHNKDFAEAKAQWIRRKARMNPNNLFIKMGFSSDTNEDEKQKFFDMFNAVPFNKILFYYGDEKVDGLFKAERFIWKQMNSDRVECFDYNAYCRVQYFWDLDLLKLLTGDKGYSRY